MDVLTALLKIIIRFTVTTAVILGIALAIRNIYYQWDESWRWDPEKRKWY